MNNTYQIVFDVAKEPLMIWDIIFFILGVIASIYAYKNKIFKKFYKERNFFFFLVYFIFMGIGLLLALASIIGYCDNKIAEQGKDVKTVIGKIENFDPMPYGGHKSES